MEMLAARLYGKEDLRVEKTPVPVIGRGEILLRVKAAALCGTDLRMFRNGSPCVDEAHPVTLAHEFAGIIEEVGPGVESYRPGQRVSVAPNLGCGICDLCVAGLGHHCRSLRALGIHLDGGFAQYVRIPADAVAQGNVTPLGPGISFEAAAACEALACVCNSAQRYAVKPGDAVLIIGAGAIGLLHARLALLSGAGLVMLNDLSPERLAECVAIEPRLRAVTGDLPAAVEELTGGRGADVVITACSAAAAQKLACACAGIDARVNFFGGLPKGRELVELDTNQIHYKQLTISGTTRSSLGQYRSAVSYVEKGLLDLDAAITHRFPLERIGEAFANAAASVGLKQAVIFQ